MAKYSNKLVEKIIDLIEEDTYSITDICTILNISRKTFYTWRETKPEFEKAINEAFERLDEKLVVKARLSLQKKLEGYTLTETKFKYIPDEEDPTQLKLKEKVVKVKEYAPDIRAIKIVLDRHEQRKTTTTEGQDPSIRITVLDDETKKQVETLKENLLSKDAGITADRVRLHIKTG